VRSPDGGPGDDDDDMMVGDDDDDDMMVGDDDDDMMMGDDDDDLVCDFGTFGPFEGDPWGDGDPSVCETASPPPSCVGDEACEPDESCTTGGCGGGYCLPRALRCNLDATPPRGCPAPSVCQMVDDGVGYCRSDDPTVTSCRGPWDCPSGFACEPEEEAPTSDPSACADGARCVCVDRRLPCRIGLDGDGVEVRSGCPVGYECRRRGDASRPWCVPRDFCDEELPCGDDDVCLGGLCVPDSGACSADADCEEAGEACTVSPADGTTLCGFDNACVSDDDCGSLDFRCNDSLHPLATAFCHPVGGCQSDAECPPSALCGWLLGNPPEAGLEELDQCLPEASCICFNPDLEHPVLGAGGAAQPCEGTP
jgi:hypothetical protein